MEYHRLTTSTCAFSSCCEHPLHMNVNSDNQVITFANCIYKRFVLSDKMESGEEVKYGKKTVTLGRRYHYNPWETSRDQM
jgi:hypothetical protein